MAVAEPDGVDDKKLREYLSELLTKGCDDRIIVNPKTGMHKYNGTNKPVPGSVQRSSCTFSIPTEEIFQKGVASLRRVEADFAEIEIMRKSICERLGCIWKIAPGTAATMFPSGTDAEFLPMLVALSRAVKVDGGKMASIITCAGEVGSGTKSASIGCHFSPILPAPNQCASHSVGGSIFSADGVPAIHAIDLKLRTSDGTRHDIEELDGHVRAAVAKAIDEDGYSVVLVHMVVGCKTGHLMPSLECMNGIIADYGEKILPVADACQVRMVDTGLTDLLADGFAVLVTGSKFYGGPPFCGVALLPEPMVVELNKALSEDAGHLRDMVKSSSLCAYISSSLVAPELTELKQVIPEDAPNLGLLLRWEMALHYIEGYHGIPEADRDRIVSEWMTQVVQIIKEKDTQTVNVVEDTSTGTEKKFRRRNTVMVKLDAKMLPSATIVLLELKRPNASDEMARLGLDELKKVHTLMATDLSGIDGLPKNPVLARRFFMAQPVTLAADFNVIRIAIGAPLVLRMYSEPESFPEIQAEDLALVEKLDVVLRSWSSV